VGSLSEAQAYTPYEPEATLSLFYKIDGIHYSTFDVGRSMFDVHQFLFLDLTGRFSGRRLG